MQPQAASPGRENRCLRFRAGDSAAGVRGCCVAISVQGGESDRPATGFEEREHPAGRTCAPRCFDLCYKKCEAWGRFSRCSKWESAPGGAMGSSEKKKEGCFVQVAGLKLVFEPAKHLTAPAGKHPCPDCHFCQQCSDDRCHSCRGEGADTPTCRSSILCRSDRAGLHDKVSAEACRNPASAERSNKADSERL